jgi:hypothetical protein
MPWKPPPPVKARPRDRLSDALLFGYVALGLYGGLWVLDDWTPERLVALSFAGVPWAVLHLAAGHFRPDWQSRWPRFRRFSLAVVLLLFAPGYALLVNALTADPGVVKRTVPFGGGDVAVRDVQRGGLGILYTTRW